MRDFFHQGQIYFLSGGRISLIMAESDERFSEKKILKFYAPGGTKDKREGEGRKPDYI